MKKILSILLIQFSLLLSYADSEKLVFAVIGMDHGHIYYQVSALIKQGAICKYAYDKDPKKVANLIAKYPSIKPATMEEILNDKEVSLITSSIIPNERFDIGKKAMLAGKDYFVDKPPLTSLAQLEELKTLVAKTGKKYIPYYGERVGNPTITKAKQLIEEGKIGKVIQVLILAPHKAGVKNRPQWFFQKERYGGIICDIGAHQFDIYMYLSGETQAKVNFARVDNLHFKEYDELEDFGEASLVGENGSSCYVRVDWFTPTKFPSFSDGKILILGSDGYIEIRSKLDFQNPKKMYKELYLCTNDLDPQIVDCSKTKLDFFKKLKEDMLNGTENAMTQEHAFKAMELCLKSQEFADKNRAK